MVDDIFPTTQPKTFEKRGLHNWRNLFKKPNGYEWTILFMLILGGMIAYSYKVETQLCRDTLNELEITACKICQAQTDIADFNKEQDDKYKLDNDNTELLNGVFQIQSPRSSQYESNS